MQNEAFRERAEMEEVGLDDLIKREEKRLAAFGFKPERSQHFEPINDRVVEACPNDESIFFRLNDDDFSKSVCDIARPPAVMFALQSRVWCTTRVLVLCKQSPYLGKGGEY